MDTSEFVRVTINRYIFHKETEKISVDMGPVLSELKELQEEFETVKEKKEAL